MGGGGEGDCSTGGGSVSGTSEVSDGCPVRLSYAQVAQQRKEAGGSGGGVPSATTTTAATTANSAASVSSSSGGNSGHHGHEERKKGGGGGGGASFKDTKDGRAPPSNEITNQLSFLKLNFNF